MDNQLDTSRVILQPFHIKLGHTKLGLMKQYVKALNSKGGYLKFIKEKLPNVNAAKVNEGVFVDPQIRELTNSSFFLR